MNTTSLYIHHQPFQLESGQELEKLEIAYQTYGTLNADKSNVIWVCHALTANADVLDWWNGLFGSNLLFNPEEHFIICANVLGSHYGTTSPLSINPATETPYYLDFPEFTTRDLAAAHTLLANSFEITHIKVLIGGSLGGQQAVEWTLSNSIFIDNLILIATNAIHSPWGIAFNESQRLAIATDPTFFENKPDGGLKGLKTARSIALLSYRTYDAYNETQIESVNDKVTDFRASSYQNYQGEKLCNRFNAYSYWFLTKAMDSHNVGRGRKSVADALSKIKTNTLVIGIENDVLFPLSEQKYLADTIKDASFSAIKCAYGHDGFLIETDKLTKIIGGFLRDTANRKNIKLHKTA
jgi:homoserine O-acetyltransferase